MADILKLLAGCFAILVIGLGSVLISGLPGSALSAQDRLQALAGQTLSATTGAGWAELSMQGQKAVVSGAAPSQEARAEALAALKASAGPGGIWLGGVTAIDASNVVIMPRPPTVSPYLWIAERQGDVVLLSGYAPSQALKSELLAHARRQFPGAEVVETLEIARGAPPDEDAWLNAASLSLTALARLTNGAVHASDAAFSITGEAQDPETATDIDLLMSVLPPQFTNATQIRVPGGDDDAPDRSAPAPETGARDSGAQDSGPDAIAGLTAPDGRDSVDERDAPDERDAGLTRSCAARLADAVAVQRIAFSSGRSELDPQSREALGALAEAMQACPQYRLRIVGHTDSTGGTIRNILLSEYRADAVAAYLGALGVSRDRFETLGLGDSEPLFDNATPEGRAGNRRIDLAVFPPTDAQQPQTRME